jgi:hypothetical protein
MNAINFSLAEDPSPVMACFAAKNTPRVVVRRLPIIEFVHEDRFAVLSVLGGGWSEHREGGEDSIDAWDDESVECVREKELMEPYDVVGGELDETIQHAGDDAGGDEVIARESLDI